MQEEGGGNGEAEEIRRLQELQLEEKLASLALLQSAIAAETPPRPEGEMESGETGEDASNQEEAIRPHEANQVEEILRLEREIQSLQAEGASGTLSDRSFVKPPSASPGSGAPAPGGRSVQGTSRAPWEWRRREKRRRRVDEGGEATREEVDEGFGADDDAFKDSPNPSEHGHSDGQRTSGIRTSDDSSEEDPYANDGVTPPLPPTPLLHPVLPLLPAPPSASSSENSAFCHPKASSEAQSEDLVELIPPDEDSDYDQDDYDEGAIVSSGSVAFSNPCSGQWSPDYRGSVGTYNSSGAYRFSSDGAQSSFEDSEDDFDRFDTDDELSYRRDSVYSCVTLPYFHSFLFIK
ncbi:unconventional myosin-X-like, partial [Gymnodraco acuticeps]|uniref:Unconventional myosin-X-like n=1 Tax=Gymnodraco acuticeps TaxID=8218 RepID=A0A6P8UL08_GYMAC